MLVPIDITKIKRSPGIASFTNFTFKILPIKWHQCVSCLKKMKNSFGMMHASKHGNGKSHQ
jgi:hypothetical protein